MNIKPLADRVVIKMLEAEETKCSKKPKSLSHRASAKNNIAAA